MTPPSLRITLEKSGPSGDRIYTWDLRLAQPNVSHVAMPSVHSIEHFLGTYLRQNADYVVLAAPMGCQTGFYIVTVEMGDFDILQQLLASAFESILNASEVPLANPGQCGWAENHSLIEAQCVARWLLDRRSTWALTEFAEPDGMSSATKG